MSEKRVELAIGVKKSKSFNFVFDVGILINC